MGKRTRAAAALALANGTGTSSLSNFLLKGSEEKDNDIFKNSVSSSFVFFPVSITTPIDANTDFYP